MPDRHAAAIIANKARWSMTTDRTTATAPARNALLDKFRSVVIANAGDMPLSADEIDAKASQLRSAYFGQLRRDHLARQRRQVAPDLSALL